MIKHDDISELKKHVIDTAVDATTSKVLNTEK